MSVIGKQSASVTSVASSASNVTLFAANANARGRTIFNESTAVLFVKFGTTASATSYTVQMATNTYFTFPDNVLYAGRVDGIWAAANGSARLTEW
jgi:hypothetical protein